MTLSSVVNKIPDNQVISIRDYLTRNYLINGHCLCLITVKEVVELLKNDCLLKDSDVYGIECDTTNCIMLVSVLLD